MRNLKVLVVDAENNENIKTCSAFCVNTNNDNVYFIQNEYVAVHEFQPGSKPTQTVVPLDPPLQETVISAEYICELDALCIGSSSGDLTTLSESTNQLECVGSVSCGLKAMSWSPDQDLLVLITGEDNLVLMTKEFDPLSETFLHPDDFGENKPVTAGWGTKETQFHGSEGKGKRNVKEVAEPVSECDDRTPVITWRGDGQMFAVSTVHPQTNIRQIRIWDREGLLLCTSEDVNGLGGPVSWRPSGSVIAGVQSLPNVHQIVFLEKNGLRHREFQLPFQKSDFEVKGLSWNSDSSVLAVYGRKPINEKLSDDHGWKVMLWTTSNYHWFLKLTLELGNREVSGLQWDIMDPYVLRLYSASTGLYVKYTLCWNTDRSLHINSNNTDDSALVAVIDGSGVNVTPFGKVVVPPPLCAYSFLLPSFTNQVLFAPHTTPSEVIVVLSDNRLARFSYNQENTIENTNEDTGKECSVKLGMVGANGGRILLQPHSFKELYTVNWDQQLPLADVPCSVHNWLWVSKEKLVCSVPNSSCGDALFSVSLTETSNSGLLGRFCCDFDLHIYAMCLAEENTITVQLTDGSVFVYNIDTNILSPWLLQSGSQLKVPQPSPFIHVCKIGSNAHLLSLSRRNRFFCDDRELLNNCTSFTVHKEFLLLTTHSHTLRCLHLQHDLPKLLNGQPMALVDESQRALERGSRLVTSVSSETRVVLQMPRGNLEAIHPRTLLLHTISNLLDRLSYKAAFQLMRKHRINLNLLYDHNPKTFMESTEVFVQDVDNCDHINLFLSELMEDDVTKTMYSSAYRHVSRQTSNNHCPGSKVDGICDKLKNVLLNIDEKRFFLSVITAHAKKTTPELDIALKKIKELQVSHPQGQEESSIALDHLLYMVDVNHLYDIALGTYDFDIVLMVAEKSQKDPKEFLQFLNSLKLLEPNYQKYKIDMHLRRYKKALVHIANCGETHFEECIQLIQAQKLHRDALHIFPTGSSQNKRVWQLYGEYLLTKRQLEEAGLAFQRSGDWESALSAHQGSLQWEMALYDAQQLGYGPVQISQLARNLSESLKMNGRHLEAAGLLEQYVQDEEECIATLVEGQLWSAALLKVGKYRRPDLLETHLKPSLRESASDLSSTIDQLVQDFTRHLHRLQTVRENKQRAEMDLPDEDEAHVDPHGDAFSETSSVTGTSHASLSNTVLSGSIATRRSNRNRQKKELKKYSLKEGSQFEDLALVSALAELVTSADGLRASCFGILKSLVFFGFDQEASLLQIKAETLYNTVETNLKTIWPPEDASVSKPLIELGPAATSNLIAASLKEQRMNRPVISDPSLRVPPQFKKDSEWKLFLLEK